MSALGVVGGLLLLLVLLAVSWTSRSAGPARASVILQTLLPAWRFFETVEATPLLLYRVVDQGRAGPWAPVIPPARRPWSALLFDPRGTALLACHGVVDRLVADLAERGPTAPEELDALVSWAVARDLATALAGLPPGTRYALRLCGAWPARCWATPASRWSSWRAARRRRPRCSWGSRRRCWCCC